MRIRVLNTARIRARGKYVLYWMTAARRLWSNFGLQRAAELARDRGVPLLILEALRCGYSWASDRHHAFVIEGMREHEATLHRTNVLYYPYLEPEPGAGKGLLEALATKAVAVVTDDFPCFFLPRMTAAAAARLDVRLEAVDSNGLLPLTAAVRYMSSAATRRKLHLDEFLSRYE